MEFGLGTNAAPPAFTLVLAFLIIFIWSSDLYEILSFASFNSNEPAPTVERRNLWILKLEALFGIGRELFTDSLLLLLVELLLFPKL